MSPSIFGLLLIAAATTATALLWYRERARRLAVARLDSLLRIPAPAFVGTMAGRQREQELAVFPARYRVIPFVIGTIVTAALRLAVGLPLEVAMAVGALVGVLSHLLEEYVAEQRIARIEAQLADAIDILVASLRAGAALLAAFETSLHEARLPIRPYLQEVVGRIRLGDDPRQVLTELPEQVPLETFRLFSMALVVHWDVGGSLASTLSTVGRTIRDRIELSRRVRTQGVEAHVSVGAVLIIAYVMGFLMWRTSPDRMEAFVRSAVGIDLVTGVIALQAVGLVWMSRISRSGF